MMGDSDSKAFVKMMGASVTHPCKMCTVNEEDDKNKDKSLREVVPTMCLTHTGRIVETIVARIVGSANDNVIDTKKPSK